MNGKLIMISIVLFVLIISVVSIGSAAKPPKNDPGIESGPGIIKADSGDGFIKYRKGSFDSVDTTSDIKSGYDDTGGPNYEWYRTYVQFDVSGLSSATSIESATLHFRVASDNINTANILELQYLSWDGNLDSSDWGITERGAIDDTFPNEETPGNWEAIDVTSQLSDAVITREENTFSIRIKHDTEPGDGNTDNYMTWYSGDDTGYEPYLNVSYTEGETPPVLEITVTTDKASYEAEETVNASGTFQWDNGTKLASKTVNVKFYNPSSNLMQDSNVTTDSNGLYWETYTLPSDADTGEWSVNVTGIYNSTESAEDSTTFTVTSEGGGQNISLTSSGDGFINYRKGSFNSVDTTSDIKSGYDDTGGPNYEWYRTYIQFDTSSLGSATSIESATLHFRVASDNINTANILELQYLSWDGNLDSSDWGITERGAIDDTFPNEETPGNWEAIDVTSQLSDAVITREESTFNVRIKHDTEPGNGNTDNYMTWYSAEDSGSEPYINVTYTEAPPVYGTLQVDLTAPSDNFEVSRYDVFNLNATVSCVGEEGAICGTVYANAMYNESGANLDTLISTTDGATPFYLVGTGTGEIVNFTDGFSPAPDGVLVMGLGYDPTDDTFWLTDTADDYAYHFSKTGSDLGDGYDLGADGITVPTGIAYDSSDNSYWVADQTLTLDDGYIYHYDSEWGDLGDDIDTGAAGAGAVEGIAYDPTDDTLWAVDLLDKFVYHFNASTGANITDGFALLAGMDWASGIAYDPTDDTLWVTDAGDDDFMYHLDKDGTNLTDGIELASFLGSDLPEEVGFDTTDNTFWIPDDTDDFVYHVGPEGAAENPISQTLSQGQNFKVSWAVNATGLSGTQYEIGVKANSSISGISENSSSVTVCIGTC